VGQGVTDCPAPSKREHVMENYSLVDRIRSEFIEMPGLRLTPAQAAKLWGVDDASCHRVIATLVRATFLRWTSAGMVVRSDR
jgi:hypothetical protein